MNQSDLHSVRMRATSKGRHISGAERIVTYNEIERTVQDLMERAQGKADKPVQIVLHVEAIETPPRALTALDLVTLSLSDITEAKSAALRVLLSTGVSEKAADVAIQVLSQGAAPSGGTMRGAIIMDSQSGERLESDQERGVRASRFDWSEKALLAIKESLAAIGLTHFRTREALALATKVAYAPAVIAELCWSDEPDYIAGYVASRKTGYVRFPILKQSGDPRGGRVFFVDRGALILDDLIHYLQTEAVLISGIGECKPAVEPEEYFPLDSWFPLRPLR